MHRFIAISFLLLLAYPSLQAQSIPPECQNREVAQREFKIFGELLLRLTRDQTREAADATYRIGLKALNRGWSSGEEQAFIDRFLSSKEYLDLQREREPHRATITEVQTFLRTSTRSTSAQSLCKAARRAQLAVELSYKINTREQEVLTSMLDAQ